MPVGIYENVPQVRSWFDRPVLSKPFILRDPQDERLVEGRTAHYDTPLRGQGKV